LGHNQIGPEIGSISLPGRLIPGIKSTKRGILWLCRCSNEESVAAMQSMSIMPRSTSNMDASIFVFTAIEALAKASTECPFIPNTFLTWSKQYCGRMQMKSSRRSETS